MKERVDSLLVARGLCESREVAKRLVMAGEVFLGTERVAKAATQVPVDAKLTLHNKPKFVGRGGLKLEGVLEHFGIEVQDFVCLDTGSSTGGFTDCLLQRGAAQVDALAEAATAGRHLEIERSLLRVRMRTERGQEYEFLALNEVVLMRGETGRNGAQR